MIKAKEARAITHSVELDQQILHEIGFTIIKEASQGNYCANITLIHKEMKSEKAYFDYFNSLGFKISYLDNGDPGLYIMW